MNEVIQIVPQEHIHERKMNDEISSIEILASNERSIQKPADSDNLQQPSSISQNHPVEKTLKQRASFKPPQFLVQLLDKQTNETPAVCKYIKDVQSIREDRIYMSYFYDQQQYIQQFYMKSGIHSPQADPIQKYMKEMLQGKLEQLQQNIVQDIHNSAIIVYKKKDLRKDDLVELDRLDRVRLIKIREGQLKSKVDILNDKMQQIKYLSDTTLKKSYKIPVERIEQIEDQLDYKSFGLDSTKTRLAEEYVIKKRNDIKKQQRRMRILLKREEQEKMQIEQERLFNEEILKKEKRDEIRGVLKHKRQKSEDDRLKNRQKQQQFMKFLLQYKNKKPLYKQKQQEFQKRYLIPLEKANEKRLKELKENHKQVSMEELIKHQKSYLEKKEQLSVNREQEIRLIMANRNLQKKIHFKSHFHSIIESEDAHADLNEEYQQKESKRKKYGQKLKNQHIPLIDENKKKELQQLIKKSERKNKRLRERMVSMDDRTFDGSIENANVVVYEEVKDGHHKKDGLRYLEFARRIGERMKHRIESAKKQWNSSEKQYVETNQLSLAHKKTSRYNNKPLSEHDAEIQKHRHLNSWTNDLKNDRLSEQQRVDRVRVKSMILDGKARDKQQMLRYAHFDTPMHEIKQKAELDEHYLSSIKAKVALLNMGD